VGVNVKDGVKDGMSVKVDEAVKVADGVNVVVDVGVGVSVAVPVITNGVKLIVGVGTVPVGVVEGVQVSVTVAINWEGLGASPMAIKPRQ
jgi:hypothetical protein